MFQVKLPSFFGKTNLFVISRSMFGKVDIQISCKDSYSAGMTNSPIYGKRWKYLTTPTTSQPKRIRWVCVKICNTIPSHGWLSMKCPGLINPPPLGTVGQQGQQFFGGIIELINLPLMRNQCCWNEVHMSTNEGSMLLKLYIFIWALMRSQRRWK